MEAGKLRVSVVNKMPNMQKHIMKILIVSLPLIACEKAADQPGPSPDSAGDTVSMPAPLARDTLSGRTFFDPQHLRVGATVGGLKVDRMNIQPSPIPTGFSGSIRFAGEVEVAGTYRPHHDYPEVNAACFFVDEAHWPKLPRARGDARIIWFCFENFQTAIEQLGPLSAESKATIIIDEYTLNMSGSDTVDSAKLIRVVRKGA